MQLQPLPEGTPVTTAPLGTGKRTTVRPPAGTSDGPLFCTSMTYWKAPPLATLAGAAIAMARSAASVVVKLRSSCVLFWSLS